MASLWWRVSAQNFNKLTNHTRRHDARAPLCALLFQPALCFGDNDVPGSGSPMRQPLSWAPPIEPHRATPHRLDCLASPRTPHSYRGWTRRKKGFRLVFDSSNGTRIQFSIIDELSSSRISVWMMDGHNAVIYRLWTSDPEWLMQ